MSKFRSLKEKMNQASDISKEALKTNAPERKRRNHEGGEDSALFRRNMKTLSGHVKVVMKSNPPQQRTRKDVNNQQSVFLREKLNTLSDKAIAALKVEVLEDEFEEPVKKQQLETFLGKQQKLSEKAIAALKNEVLEDEYRDPANKQQSELFREKFQKSSEKTMAAIKAEVLEDEFDTENSIKQVNNSIEKIEKVSANAIKAMKAERLLQRFNKGAHTAAKLKKSLAVTGYHHLSETTLLTHDVHKQHAALLAGRYLKQWNSVVKNSISVDVARERFRFLTLLDRIEVPDPNIALKAISEFKESLLSVAASSTGIWLLGCIEVEVVSLELMRHCRKLATTPNRTTSTEMRKLDVCETLLKKLPLIQRNLPCYLLIHFHGVVSAKSASRFEQFRTNLKNNKRWSQAPRQIELKKMSDIYRGRQKSMEQNLTDTADYITKGGNDWKKKRAYFKYKLNFDENASYDELLPDLKNWRKQGVLNDMHKEEPVEEPLSLTLGEISLLAQIIDGMMSFDKNRTGYLVSKT